MQTNSYALTDVRQVFDYRWSFM